MPLYNGIDSQAMLDVAIEEGIGIKTIAMALHESAEILRFQHLSASGPIDGMDANFEADFSPHAL